MKKAGSIIIVFLFSFALNGQQIGMYSHYFYKPMVYNPAFTGTGNATNVMFISRSQWSDFKGSPQLNIATFDGNLKSEKIGLGVMLVSDRKGITNRIGGDISYSYRLNINYNMHLLFGVSIGVIDQTIDYSKALVESPDDATLFSDPQRKIVFNGNAGLAFVWNNLEFGFAVPQIIGNKINYVDSSNVRGYYTQARHYMSSLKYKFFLLENKGISIDPQVLIRFVPNTPFQYDGNINFDWQDKFWLGVTYKSDYAIGANVGFCLHKQLYVGYSYDFIIGNIGKYAGTSHELMVNFKFGKNKNVLGFVEKSNDGNALENVAYVNRMDSLQDQLEESQDKLKELNVKLDKQTEKKSRSVKSELEDTRMDSFQDQLNDSQKKIIELSDKLNEQSKQLPVQTTTVNNQDIVQNRGPNNENQNTQINSNSKNKIVEEEEPLIITYHTNEFKDVYDQGPPPKGFYVVAGTFSHLHYAKEDAQLFVIKGHTTNWIYSGPNELNYILIFKCSTKEKACGKLKIAQKEGTKDAWLLELID